MCKVPDSKVTRNPEFESESENDDFYEWDGFKEFFQGLGLAFLVIITLGLLAWAILDSLASPFAPLVP